MPASIGDPRSAHATARRVMLSLLSVLVAGGCSLTGDIRRSPSPRPSTGQVPGRTAERPASWLVETGPGMIEVRTAAVQVPGDHRRRTVAFADMMRGAALFTRCPAAGGGPGTPAGCSAVLLVTQDGGRTWLSQPSPITRADAYDLRVRPDGTLLLRAAPHGWYRSADLGTTFEAIPGGDSAAPEALGVAGPFAVCCAGGPARVVRWVDGRRQEVSPPPLPGVPLTVTHRPGRDLWAGSVTAGRPYTAYSPDEGRTWRPAAVPAPAVRLAGLVVRASADGADLWLTGTAAGGRPVAFWRLDGAGWRPLPAARPGAPGSSAAGSSAAGSSAAGSSAAGSSAPGPSRAETSAPGSSWAETSVATLPADVAAAAPAGSGLLVVTGSTGAGLVGERYTPTDWPLVGRVDQLADGTLLATDEGSGEVWLGRGEGAVRRWALLEFRQE